jgi:hypothetical protein
MVLKGISRDVGTDRGDKSDISALLMFRKKSKLNKEVIAKFTLYCKLVFS